MENGNRDGGWKPYVVQPLAPRREKKKKRRVFVYV
jgi:hypothetical protein